MARKKHFVRLGAGVAVILIALSSFGAYQYRRPIPVMAAETVQGVSDKAESVSLPWPAYGGAAIGAKGYGILATHGSQKPLPTASVAKVMTALAVLQKKPLSLGEHGPTLTLTKADQAIYDYYFSHDGSLAAIKVGEKITEYQALEALLLPSANNFADTLAIWAFGSLKAYSDYANGLAKTFGMTNSNFSDPSGFSPATVSTAEDLVKLGQTALQNPVIAEIVAKPSATIPVAGKIYNVNGLLGKHGINGVKTGNTDQAGGVFMGSTSSKLANGQPLQLVSVIMGAPNLVKSMQDSVPLLDAAKANFIVKTPVKAGQSFGSFVTPWDHETIRAVAGNDGSLLAWRDTHVRTSVSLGKISTKTTTLDLVGSVTITSDNKKVTVPLKLEKNPTQPTFWWRLTHH